MTTETAATSVKAGVLGMLRAVPGVKHAPSCWPKNWPDSCDQLEPYQSLGRLVSGLMLRAEVTPRLGDCTGEPLCRCLACSRPPGVGRDAAGRGDAPAGRLHG